MAMVWLENMQNLSRLAATYDLLTVGVNSLQKNQSLPSLQFEICLFWEWKFQGWSEINPSLLQIRLKPQNIPSHLDFEIDFLVKISADWFTLPSLVSRDKIRSNTIIFISYRIPDCNGGNEDISRFFRLGNRL